MQARYELTLESQPDHLADFPLSAFFLVGVVLGVDARQFLAHLVEMGGGGNRAGCP